MKVGDVHTSDDGHSFTVVAFDKHLVVVDIERTVRKGGQHSPAITENRQREVPVGWRFDTFAKPYTILNGRKKAAPSAKDPAVPVRPRASNPKNT